MRGAALLVLALAAGPVLAQPEAVAGFGPEGAARRLLVRGTTDIPLFAPALEGFLAAAPGLRIDYEQWGSNDLYNLARAACTGDAPAADLVISSAVDLQVKLVNDGCAQPHVSARTAILPAAAIWRDELFGVTREPAVMVYNTERVPRWEVPRSRFDLIDLLRRGDGPYAGRVATYDIEDSGLGFLFAFADSQAATTFGGLIEAFGRSGAVATCCSAEIIDGVAEGRWLIAYNVLGSYALARAAEDPRIAVVAPEDYTLMLARAAMIPRSAANPGDAGELVDFLLGPAGRAALARTRLMVDVDGGDDTLQFPGGDDATLRPIALSPVLLLGLDRAKRAQFLELWRATFPTE
jgi:ABC-type Fe3+ transport system substrate-binding protein